MAILCFDINDLLPGTTGEEIYVLSGQTRIRSGLTMTSTGFHQVRVTKLSSAAFLLGIVMMAPVVGRQSFVADMAARETPPNSRTVNGLTGDEIVERMIDHNRLRNEQLESYSAVRRYEIQNPDGRVSAETVVRVNYRAPGKKTFQKVSEEGSWVVRHLVFDRLLQSEQETSSGQERRDSAISDMNYQFKIVGEETLGSNHCFIVEAKPKRPDKYLFEGELWIDAQDFGIAKIAGRPAAKLSFWINRADFVRQFQKIDGFWLPYLDETIVDLKIHGTRVFRIEHKQYVINAPNHLGLQQQN
jgi:outer membrane lipoprotein-sorting protein